MTQEDKDLLLKDLCARLPYGVKLQKTYDTSEPIELYSINLNNSTVNFYKYKGEGLTICDVGDIKRFGKLRYKPYLFPLSNVTDEQMEELEELCNMYTPDDDYHPYAYKGITVLYKHVDGDYKFDFKIDVIDWFNKNHIDYKGLIPKGLAIDATGLNIY